MADGGMAGRTGRKSLMFFSQEMTGRETFFSSVFVMSSLMFFVLLQDVQQTFQSSFALVEANFR